MKSLLKSLMAACSLILLASLSLNGQINFKDVTRKAGLIEPLRGMKGHGAAWGDVTGNGYPDLFYGTFSIYRAGMLGEKEGMIGTRIISISNGYSSGSEAIAYFGVPDDKTVDILMTMPTGGKVYARKGIKRNQMIIIND